MDYLFVQITALFVICNVNCEVNLKVVTNSLEKRLALEVLKLQPNVSLVVSSLAVGLALCKLATVADDEAKKELMSVLGIKKEKLLYSCYAKVKEPIGMLKQSDLILYNKIYVNYSDDIQPAFITNSSEIFGVQVEKIGFNYPQAAVQFINKWIESAMYKRVTDVLQPTDVDKNTTIVLLSAAHFKGTWEFPFDIRLTRNRKFHHHNNRIAEIPMMTRSDVFSFYHDDVNDFQICTLMFGSSGATITFVVPTSSQGLPELIDKLHKNPDLLKYARRSMKWSYIKVVIPRFKIKSYVEWIGFLEEIGITKIFDSKSSGLNGILKQNVGNKNIQVNTAKQKIFLEIDEMGVTRHIQGMEDPTTMTYELNAEEFVLDRPFYFTINLEVDDTYRELFNGVYYGPE